MLNKIRLVGIELLKSSTIHGIPNILRSQRISLQLIWFVCFLTSFSMCSFMIIRTTLDYLEYEVVSRIDVFYENESQFPTISFCKKSIRNFRNMSLNGIKLIACSFNFDECIPYIGKFTDFLLGECYSFNMGVNLDNKTFDLLNSKSSGIIFGLGAFLYMPSNEEYFEISISFYNSTSRPFNLLENSFSISSGSRNYFTINRIFSEKLEKPFNDCFKDVKNFNKNNTLIDYISNTGRKYTHNECISLCRNLNILENSNCSCNVSLENVIMDCVFKQGNRCVIEFINKFQKKSINEICANYCPLECDTLTYDISTYSQQIASSGNITKEEDHPELGSYDILKKGYFEIYVYYSELKYTLISQKAKTTLYDLISNIGGILGLFLGISFLSMVEIIEFIIEITYILLSREKIEIVKNIIKV